MPLSAALNDPKIELNGTPVDPLYDQTGRPGVSPRVQYWSLGPLLYLIYSYYMKLLGNGVSISPMTRHSW